MEVWIPVDKDGKVAGVEASLPNGYEVLINGSNQVIDIRPIAVPDVPVTPAPAQTSTVDAQV